MSAAAGRLFISQPAVSAVVAALQRELGVTLVAREGRGLRVTPAGATLADYARRVAGLLDEAGAATIAAADPERGQARLAAVTTAGEHILPAAIAGFRRLHPQAEVSLEVANRPSVRSMLEDHEVDAVVGGRPAPSAPLVTRAVRPYALVLVAAPGLVRSPASAAELARLTWLLREPGSGTRATAEELLARLDIGPVRLTLGSNGAVREAAAARLGITMIAADAVAAELAAGRLVEVRAPGVPVRREWHVVVRAGDALPATCELFVRHLLSSGEFQVP